MSRTKLANLTVDQLVECFVAIALDQHEAAARASFALQLRALQLP